MPVSPVARRPLVTAVLLSFTILLAAAWIRGGVASTAYDTRDSHGRTMGFNDVFSGEHYSILLGKANWPEAVKQLEPLDGLLIAAHVALLILLATASARTIRWFLWPQAVVFFWGWAGFWFLPIAIFDLVWAHTSDREGFVDIPYISILSQGAWFWACGFVLWKLRRQSLTATAATAAGSTAQPA